MTEDEITDAAWRELLSGAQSALDDWIDEEGEYGDDADAVLQRQREIMARLEETGRMIL